MKILESPAFNIATTIIFILAIIFESWVFENFIYIFLLIVLIVNIFVLVHLLKNRPQKPTASDPRWMSCNYFCSYCPDANTCEIRERANKLGKDYLDDAHSGLISQIQEGNYLNAADDFRRNASLKCAGGFIVGAFIGIWFAINALRKIPLNLKSVGIALLIITGCSIAVPVLQGISASVGYFLPQILSSIRKESTEIHFFAWQALLVLLTLFVIGFLWLNR